MAALFAICSAFLYGLSIVITRIALRYANILSAVLISLLSCVVSSLILCLFFTSPSQFLNTAVLFFLAAGIIGPFFGRFFLYQGIDRVGTSIASPLYETKPLFSAIAAVFILGEKLTSPIACGVLLMMVGTATISLEQSGGQIEKKWSKKDLVFPLISGACYGVAHVLRKMGLNVAPEPIVGVMVQNVGALAFTPLLILTQKNHQRSLSKNKKAWVILSLAGILHVAAQWCFFKALHLGKVVVVSPLASLSTFFVLLLAALFLRGLEKVTWRIILGAVLIVGATWVLTAIT
jgi:drug/metabolite transporter (DMT)-like permease